MATDAPTPPPGSLLRRSELILAGSLLALLGVFIIPLPTIVLDLLLTLNLAATLLLMLVVLTVKRPLEFSTFPSLLLLMTLFRLALNVATTRLVLLHGDAGEVVSAFGKFVVGGNLVVGLVVFAILIVIQFIVITRGAGRISEVSARFTLDAIPGKQLAIDAELNAGLIDAVEARRRRAEVMRESEFYGTMDGASKFVRGDAVAAIIITAVNLIGGIIIGLIGGLSAGAAVKKYSILTIGDGLITQIPALVIATASGILVTKANSESSLGQELGGQFESSAGSLRLAGIIVFLLGCVPGLPNLPFLFLGALLFFLGRYVGTLVKKKAEAAIVAAATQAAPGTPGAAPGTAPTGAPAEPTAETYAGEFLQAEGISLEIGRLLFPYLKTRRNQPGLVDRIAALRKDLGRSEGLWVPRVHVTDDTRGYLPAGGYRILIRGRAVAQGEVRPDMHLAMDTGNARFPLVGEDTTEPVFGLPAKWISDSDKARAEMGNYSVVDGLSVVITHLSEIVRRFAPELLSREDLKAILDRVRASSPAVVDEVNQMLPMGALHKVVTILLSERVPITNMTRILESLTVQALATKDPIELAERIRPDIGRAICERYISAVERKMHVIILAPNLANDLRAKLLPNQQQLQMDFVYQQQLTARVSLEYGKAMARGMEAALMSDAVLRRGLRNLLQRSVPGLSVISYTEIPPDVQVDFLAAIRPEDLASVPSNIPSFLESAPK